MNETDAQKPTATTENADGAHPSAVVGLTPGTAAMPAELVDGVGGASDDDEPLDEIASIKGVEKHVQELEALKRELEQAQRQGAAMVKAAAPVVIRAMAEVPLPRGYGERLWKKIQKKPKLQPAVRSACYFVCVHLWEQDDAADLANSG